MYQRLQKLLRGKTIERTPEAQQRVDQQTAQLTLYHFPACPFCHVVRRQITRLALKIELRDIQQSRVWHKELLRGGGKEQVPCLRIQEGEKTRWMYESAEIVGYLKKRFDEKQQKP